MNRRIEFSLNLDNLSEAALYEPWPSCYGTGAPERSFGKP